MNKDIMWIKYMDKQYHINKYSCEWQTWTNSTTYMGNEEYKHINLYLPLLQK